MIHHVSVGTNDLERSKRFYDAVLPIVGILPLSVAEDAVGYSWRTFHFSMEVPIDGKDTPVADILRWRRFGWAAWHGREPCPHCNSTLRAVRYELSWWVYPLLGRDGRLGVGVPCQRCDPWTPEKVYELTGEGAEMVLRRLLA